VFGFIVTGLFIGALARMVKPRRQHLGLAATLTLGVAGSVVGGLVAFLLGTGELFELNVFGFVLAVVTAVALISHAERMTETRVEG